MGESKPIWLNFVDKSGEHYEAIGGVLSRAFSDLKPYPMRDVISKRVLIFVLNGAVRRLCWLPDLVMRILIAEDDVPLAGFLRKGFEAESYAVDVAMNGEEAEELAGTYPYDALIMDWNLPKRDGISALRGIRENKSGVPVLMLTGRNRIEDRVQALDCGADDYLMKPFSFAELSARIRALMRRGRTPLETRLQVDDLVLDRLEHRVERSGKQIELTSKEFSLLEYLMRNAGRRITRAMIIEHVWSITFDTSTNVVDVYINYLRKKVDEGAQRKLIHTVRGIGYELSAKTEAVC